MNAKELVSLLSDCATIITAIVGALAWLFTRRKLPHFWRKYNKAFSVLLVALVFFGFWKLGWLDWLAYTYNWSVLGLAALFVSGPLVLGIVVAAVKVCRRRPEYLNYITDEVYGVAWQWDYPNGSLKEDRLLPLCPSLQCSCTLDPQQQFDGLSAYHVTLVCDHCGFRKEFGFSYKELQKKVVREIDRRYRTREFKQRPS